MELDELFDCIDKFYKKELNKEEIVKNIQEYIDNDNDIINLTYLGKNDKYKKLFSFLIYKRDILSRIIFPKPGPKRYGDKYKTIEDFQKFIDDNDIKNDTDFQKRFSGLYGRKNRVLNPKQRSYLKYPNPHIVTDYSNLRSINDFQKYIDQNNLKSPIELFRFNSKIFHRLYSIFSNEDRLAIKWENYHDMNKWSSIDSVNKLQEIIDNNLIINRTDLYRRFRGLYEKFKEDLSSVHFCGPMTLSTGEYVVIQNLIKYNINFVYQKSFSDCKNILAYRFDFYLIDLNILLEYHGAGHFGVGKHYTDELIKSDKQKYEYAKKNNIKIVYYTLEKKLYDKFGYFDTVYTNFDKLLLDIGIDTSKENQNYFNDIKLFFQQDINYFNKFIERNKIKTLKELREKFSSTYERIKKKKLQPYLLFYK